MIVSFGLAGGCRCCLLVEGRGGGSTVDGESFRRKIRGETSSQGMVAEIHETVPGISEYSFSFLSTNTLTSCPILKDDNWEPLM
jgi:hypothetical protein